MALWILSGVTRVIWYQKGKTNLDFTEARDSEWQWHQLGHMQICTSPHTDNHANIPPLSFFTSWMPFLPPNQQRQSTDGIVAVISERVFVCLLDKLRCSCQLWLHGCVCNVAGTRELCWPVSSCTAPAGDCLEVDGEHSTPNRMNGSLPSVSCRSTSIVAIVQFAEVYWKTGPPDLSAFTTLDMRFLRYTSRQTDRQTY